MAKRKGEKAKAQRLRAQARKTEQAARCEAALAAMRRRLKEKEIREKIALAVWKVRWERGGGPRLAARIDRVVQAHDARRTPARRAVKREANAILPPPAQRIIVDNRPRDAEGAPMERREEIGTTLRFRGVVLGAWGGIQFERYGYDRNVRIERYDVTRGVTDEELLRWFPEAVARLERGSLAQEVEALEGRYRLDGLDPDHREDRMGSGRADQLIPENARERRAPLEPAAPRSIVRRAYRAQRRVRETGRMVATEAGILVPETVPMWDVRDQEKGVFQGTFRSLDQALAMFGGLHTVDQGGKPIQAIGIVCIEDDDPDGARRIG